MGVDPQFDKEMSDFKKFLGNDCSLPMAWTPRSDQIRPRPLRVQHVPQSDLGLLQW